MQASVHMFIVVAFSFLGFSESFLEDFSLDTFRTTIVEMLDTDVSATNVTVRPEAAPTRPLSTANSSTAVVLAIDTSDSMYGTPLLSAKEAARTFLEDLDPATEVAIVTFSSKSELVHDFSTNRTSLTGTIDGLLTGGVTALYDGGLLAVETAAKSDAQQQIVVLLSDGAEYGGQSAALREDARELAAEEDVMVFTVGLGFGADRTFLEDIADETGGAVFDAPTPADLVAIYSDLSASFSELAAPTPAPAVELAADGSIPSMEAISADTAQPIASMTDDGFNDASAQFINNSNLILGTPFREITPTENPSLIEVSDFNTILSGIPALEDSLLAIGLNDPIPGALDADLAGTGANSTLIEALEPGAIGAAERDILIEEALADTFGEQPGSELSVTGLPITDRPTAELPMVDALDSGIIPITVALENAELISEAELAVNGFNLSMYETAPFEHDLNLERLEEGLYNLSFTAVYESGSIAMGEMEFEVAAVPASSGTPLLELHLDGVRTSSLDLDFSPETGLVAAEPVRTLGIAPNGDLGEMSLMTIISRPINQVVPPEMMSAVSQPRPMVYGTIIIVMTLILTPQGIFTLMWMLYTWNNPRAAAEYASPSTYEEPQLKFTAMLPARKEEAVIYETIMKVDAIDYPEELKEILVLVRDENDDETIAEVKRAMADLGNKPNVRLVTFTDGPYNKPNGLNRGFDQGTGDVFCIFDAEDHPHREIYNIVNTTMQRKEADVVQSGVQLMTYFGQEGKEPWFAALNVLEYFFWFKSGLHFYTREFNVTPLGGNTVFAKREWLDRIAFQHNRWHEGHHIQEVWDENCLTEDADLGIRLTNAGASIQIVYTAEHATQEETPSNVEQFIKQRTRWNQGFYEIFRKGDWMGMPTFKQKIVAMYILLNSLLQGSVVLFLPLGIFIALTQEIPVPLAIISWIPIYLLLLQMVTQLVGIREYAESYGIRLPRGYRLKMILYYYPFQLLLAVSAVRAVHRFIVGTNNWEKTSHSGAHRTTAPAAPAASPRPVSVA